MLIWFYSIANVDDFLRDDENEEGHDFLVDEPCLDELCVLCPILFY